MITSDFPVRCLPNGSRRARTRQGHQRRRRTLAELRQLRGRPVLIKGAIILSQDPAVGDYAAGDILIHDGKITQVGEDLARQADEEVIIDAAGLRVMTGEQNPPDQLAPSDVVRFAMPGGAPTRASATKSAP